MFLDPQDEVGPSISFSVVLCSFFPLVYIVVLVLVVCLCPSSVRVVATFPGVVSFPFTVFCALVFPLIYWFFVCSSLTTWIQWLLYVPARFNIRIFYVLHTQRVCVFLLWISGETATFPYTPPSGWLVGASQNSEKPLFSFVMSFPPARPTETTRLPLDGVSWNLILEYFWKILSRKFGFD
jgi:hypothetical protein